jgi:hypothetical protein
MKNIQINAVGLNETMNKSFEECKVSGKICKVQFGHHAKSLQHSN